MSRRIFKDIEEALAREVRRITFHENRTVDEIVLEEAFDPFTGELVKTHVEADFYDSSADTGHRQYPHFFIKLVKVREDLTTGRVESQFGNQVIINDACNPKPVSNPMAYTQIIPLKAGTITAPGNTISVKIFNIRKVEEGHILRILSGPNKGSYIIDEVIIDPNGNHSIIVSSTILEDLPEITFDETTRIVTFTESVDLNTVKVGDTFEDSTSTLFNITAIDLDNVSITIDGSTSPDLSEGSSFVRPGSMFPTIGSGPTCFVILDPEQPILNANGGAVAVGSKAINAPVPIDAFYMIRIDSKEKSTHVEVLNRMLEEFNPLRGSLQTIVRMKNSAEELLTEDLPSGGSNELYVNNADFNVNDNVFVIDDFSPTRSTNGGFSDPFKAKIIGKIDDNIIVLDKTVPDSYKLNTTAKVVSNAEYRLLFLHFVDHRTRDVEGAQYWVHEFDFWIQFNMDRKGEAIESVGNVIGVATPIEDTDGNVIISGF